MYAVETLKKNITVLFSTLAFVFDEDADDVIDFICDMDFPEIYLGIRKRVLPIFRHATGAFDQDQGSDFPNEEYWLELEDVFEALISFWKQDAKDNLNIFYES